MLLDGSTPTPDKGATVQHRTRRTLFEGIEMTAKRSARVALVTLLCVTVLPLPPVIAGWNPAKAIKEAIEHVEHRVPTPRPIPIKLPEIKPPPVVNKVLVQPLQHIVEKAEQVATTKPQDIGKNIAATAETAGDDIAKTSKKAVDDVIGARDRSAAAVKA